MPPTTLLKDLSKLKHPNSRKTKALARKAKRFNDRNKVKLGHAVKSNILGDKFVWFTEQVSEDDTKQYLTPDEFETLIELYLQRFDEELEQIAIKQSISKNRTNQHASRLDVIKMTIDRETNEYKGAGIELLNLCDPIKFKIFMEWDGNSVNLQHFKLERISKKFLQKLKLDMENNKME